MTRVVVTILSFAVAAALLISAYAIYSRFQLGEQRREQQASINKRLAEANRRIAEANARTAKSSLENCKEIEQLKTVQRERAIENFKHLDANLRLLNIPKTPAVVKAAQDSLDRDLARFAAAPCPRR